jgi:hypothetical protein
MDNLDELLTPSNAPAERAGMREQLRNETGRVVRRRRWRKPIRNVLALAACYAAGMGTYWLIRDRTPEVQIAPPIVMTQPPPTPTKPATIRIEPPNITERWASLATEVDRRVELYRKAGDGYLARDDEMAALRCYRKSLDNSRADDLVIRPQDDSWLLMSLKLARQKETDNARN